MFTWRRYRVDFSNSGAERGKIKGPERHGFWDIVSDSGILGKCQDLAKNYPSKKMPSPSQPCFTGWFCHSLSWGSRKPRSPSSSPLHSDKLLGGLYSTHPPQLPPLPSQFESQSWQGPGLGAQAFQHLWTLSPVDISQQRCSSTPNGPYTLGLPTPIPAPEH